MLECRNIIKTYRAGEEDNVVLKGVSFSIKKGEFVAIMGPSGSGKSTLMNIIGCLDTPTSGEYLLDGEDVSKLDEDRLAEVRARKIGFVFQSFNLLQRATVMRNVTMPLAFADVPRAERHDRAAAALRAAALDEKYWEYRPNQLSGGMMQRVAIARALVNDPAIILADEPTGNLDTKTGEQVLIGFQELNREQGRTIIMITHEHDVADHAGRIITLRDGNIVSDKANDCPTRANTAIHQHD
jgi:putative ABC transport system ATP-binding protein